MIVSARVSDELAAEIERVAIARGQSKAAWMAHAMARAVLAPENRDDVLALLARQPDTDDDIAAQMYATLLDPLHGICAGGAVDPAAFEAVLRLRAGQGGFESDHDLAALSRAGGGLVR